MKVELILGGPGSGKTTELLNIVERELESGIKPSEIAFVAFTRAAANEAAERAAIKFRLDAKKDLPWFRTIHSLAYQRLGLARDEIIGNKDLRTFGKIIGEDISGNYELGSPVTESGSNGDIMMRMVDYANTTGLSLPDAWHYLGEPIDWYALKRFDAAYRAYKTDLGKIDFTDMLLTYSESGDPLNCKVAIIDEGQDLTRAQWSVIHHAFKDAERVYIGGDDDQAIYRWAGADVDYFLNISTDPRVLPYSHRLPKSVYHLAQKVAARIRRRYSKPYEPTDRHGGVHYHQAPEHVDLTSGNWLLIARNRYHTQRLIEYVRTHGVNYFIKNIPAIQPKDVEAIKLWEDIQYGRSREVTARELRSLHGYAGLPRPSLKELDKYKPEDYLREQLQLPWYVALNGISHERREYYIACMRRGERLTNQPRIRIDTIHGVKGAEADNVLLMTDMSYKTQLGFEAEPDNEHRVFYVGITRAKDNLHIITPQNDRGYVF